MYSTNAINHTRSELAAKPEILRTFIINFFNSNFIHIEKLRPFFFLFIQISILSIGIYAIVLYFYFYFISSSTNNSTSRALLKVIANACKPFSCVVIFFLSVCVFCLLGCIFFFFCNNLGATQLTNITIV